MTSNYSIKSCNYILLTRSFSLKSNYKIIIMCESALHDKNQSQLNLNGTLRLLADKIKAVTN